MHADVDYEYCYDIAGKQSGRCAQRDPAKYSDAAAQAFLDTLTTKLRSKLDALQVSNGYSRGRYEVTHAPMDSDLTPSSSAYFQVLHNRRSDLDFLMPQFYNGGKTLDNQNRSVLNKEASHLSSSFV